MRGVFPGLALLVALAIVGVSLVALPQTASASVIVRASAVNFTLNYSDPASDVFQLWTSNNSHVTTAGGFWVMSPSPGTVNLIRLSSWSGGNVVNAYIKVQTTITVASNVTYQMRFYTRADNSTHYVMTYRNGQANMVSNHTGAIPVNMTANATVGSLGWLGFRVGKSLLGNITAWNIDATAIMVAGNYTYEDFGWSQPGNPGSAPAFIQGRVTDAATRAGLSGVNVSTGSAGYFTTTNATGYYSLPAAPGNFTMTFSLSGYDSATKAVSVQYQQTQTVNAQLSKTQPSPLSSPVLWAGVIVLVVVVGAITFLVLRRRKKPEPPKPQS